MMFRRPQFVVTATFLVSLCQGFMFLSIPLIGKEHLKVSPAMLGYYGFVPAVFGLIGSWLGGRWSDRYGRKRILAISMSLPLLGLLLFVVCQSRYLFFLPIAVFWGTIAMYWPCIEAAANDGQTSIQMKRGSGMFSLSWMMGLVVGPIIGNYMYSHIHPYSPMAATFVILVAVLAMLHLPKAMEIAPWGANIRLDHEERVPQNKRALLLQMAFLGNMTTYFMLASYRSLLAEYTTPIGINKWGYGLLQASIVLGMVLTTCLLLVWHRWHYSVRFLVVSELVAVVSLVAFSFCDSYTGLLIISAILGFPCGVTYFGSIYYGMELSKNKGAHGGNHETIIAVGKVTGPLLGGWTIAATGMPRAEFLLCAIAFLGVAALQAAMARSYQRNTKQATSSLVVSTEDLV